MNGRRSEGFEAGERASVLVGLLWCVALLTIVVAGVLHVAGLDLRVGKNYGDLIQAHYLALAGVEKAKALLFHEARERRRSKVNHSGKLFDAPEEFRDARLGRGEFRLLRQTQEGLVYGISDEESKLNVNLASAEELGKLPSMTAETAASIVDYRDQDNNVTQGGAEEESYLAMKPPYLPRNGPLLTLRETLMVRGLSWRLFADEDSNLNGLLDPEENDGEASFPSDNQDGILDSGWSGLLTVDSEVRLESADGEKQVNIQEGAEEDLAAVEGLSAELAKAIVAYRSQRRLESLADLLEVTAPAQNQRAQPQTQLETAPEPSRAPGRSARGGTDSSPRPPRNNQTGPKLISQELLKEIADHLTTQTGTKHAGPVNINTAGVDVLACLPGMDRQMAQAIVNYRRSSGFFPNIAYLLEVSGMSQELFKQVAPRVTARSETFRILSEGLVPSSGARKRILVTVRIASSYVDTLSYREDDL